MNKKDRFLLGIIKVLILAEGVAALTAAICKGNAWYGILGAALMVVSAAVYDAIKDDTFNNGL